MCRWPGAGSGFRSKSAASSAGRPPAPGAHFASRCPSFPRHGHVGPSDSRRRYARSVSCSAAKPVPAWPRSWACAGRADTLLRLVRQAPAPPAPTPRVLSIDDWSYRRGTKYGTMLLDLERRVPIDLLPDREVATCVAWLQAHPGIEIISRDRSKTYAAPSQSRRSSSQTGSRPLASARAPHRRVFDPFCRKERLRANDLWDGDLPGGKPQGDQSMSQSRTCLKAFRARSDCPARHGEAALPNLANQRRKPRPSL